MDQQNQLPWRGSGHFRRPAQVDRLDSVTQRWLQALAEAADATSIATCNEYLKMAMRHRMTAKEGLDPFLQIDIGLASHHLYVGPTPIAKLPGFIVTDMRSGRHCQ